MSALNSIAELERVTPGTKVLVFGKICTVRKLGGITFATLMDQTGQCRLVFEKRRCSFLKGDFVTVCGEIKEWESNKEIHVMQCSLCGDSNPRGNLGCISEKKIDKLILKSKAIQEINQYLHNKGFLPVSSPTIVGNWVEGKTKSFEVNYFGTKKYLTLNSMLYHQIMLISGYNKIYEFSKIFRQDATSPKDRLSEFISLDISMSNSNKYEMMNLIENMILELWESFSSRSISKMPRSIVFNKMSYFELMELSGCNEISGAQLSAKAREYLNEHCPSFVWIYGFPEEKRRFFVKSKNGKCEDYQLWYKGYHQVASGGERETNLETIKEKIKNEGKNVENYKYILYSYENGVPPMCEIGFGLDRFLLDISESTDITDFVAFPRNGSTSF